MERPEGDAVGQTQEEAETEAVKETDQISAGTEEGSGVGEGHTGVSPLAKTKRSRHVQNTHICVLYVTAVEELI